MNLKYPFLSVILNKKTEEQIVCLIQCVSKNYVSFYDVDRLKAMDRERFVRLVTQWWNMEPSLPISLYYKDIFDQFNYCKSHLSSMEYKIIQGFDGINLKNISDRRIKRKVVHYD